MKRTYLALPLLLLALLMGAAIQSRPLDLFFMKDGPGWVYCGRRLTNSWLALFTMTRGDGDQMRWRSGGNGEDTRYDGECRMGEMSGIVGVPSGDGDLE